MCQKQKSVFWGFGLLCFYVLSFIKWINIERKKEERKESDSKMT